MANFIPENDNSFNSWMGNFAAVAQNNEAILGFNDNDMDKINDAHDLFSSDLTKNVAARAVAVAATSKKNVSRKAAEVVFRQMARRIQANPDVPENLKAQLGISTGSPIPAPVVPVPPVDLVVNGYDNGTNALVWKNGGNKTGTLYAIEAKIGSANAWQLVDVTTRTKWNHSGQRPGVPALYRICARRGENASGCSNEASVYAGM